MKYTVEVFIKRIYYKAVGVDLPKGATRNQIIDEFDKKHNEVGKKNIHIYQAAVTL